MQKIEQQIYKIFKNLELKQDFEYCVIQKYEKVENNKIRIIAKLS